MAKKKASKKQAAKAESKPVESMTREPDPAPAIQDEPMCYNRKPGGSNQYMTLSEAKKKGLAGG